MQSNEVIQIDPKSITRPPQVRTVFSESAHEEMIASIKTAGILQPVLLRRKGAEHILLDGERRIRAAIAAGLATVPALVNEEVLGVPEIIQRQLIANCVREDLSPIDKAKAVQQLMNESGYSAAEVAGRIGTSPATISKLLAVLNAPVEVQAQIASGDLGIKAAYQMVRGSADTARNEVTPVSARKPSRRSKLTAMLDATRSVTVHGIDSTIDAFVAVLDELLARTKAARKQGIELPTLLAMYLDQAKA